MSGGGGTLADVMAEMRATVESAEAWQGGVAAATVARLADRIEAAAKREREAWEESACRCVSDATIKGDAAAMREALEAVHRIACTAKNDFDVFAGIERIRRISGAALAAQLASPCSSSRFACQTANSRTR